MDIVTILILIIFFVIPFSTLIIIGIVTKNNTKKFYENNPTYFDERMSYFKDNHFSIYDICIAQFGVYSRKQHRVLGLLILNLVYEGKATINEYNILIKKTAFQECNFEADLLNLIISKVNYSFEGDYYSISFDDLTKNLYSLIVDLGNMYTKYAKAYKNQININTNSKDTFLLSQYYCLCNEERFNLKNNIMQHFGVFCEKAINNQMSFEILYFFATCSMYIHSDSGYLDKSSPLYKFAHKFTSNVSSLDDPGD